MNRKHAIVVAAAFFVSSTVTAQTSLEDGVKMYKYERYQTAKTILTPLATSSTTANYYLGLCELKLEKTKEAKAIFGKYADDVANTAGLARVEFELKNTTEANRLVAIVASKATKKNVEPLRYAADAINYTEGGNYQQAIDWYKDVLKKNDNAETRIAIGDAYLKMPGGGGEAMNNYEAAVAKDAKNSLAYTRIGEVWYAAKRYDLALENYQKAKDADSDNPLPYKNLANAYYWVGKYDIALTNIQTYLDKSDKSAEDQVQYMYILYLAKKYDDAIAKAKELMNTGIMKPSFYGVLAYSYLEKKDFKNALDQVRIYFAQQNPAKILSKDLINYGKILLGNSLVDSVNRKQLVDSAELFFKNAMIYDTAHSTQLENYKKIAESYKDSKEFELAAVWYNKFIDSNPNATATDYFWRGVMSYYAKDYATSMKSFEEMAVKFPEQPSAVYWQGRNAAAIDDQGKSGIAEKFYLDWLTKVGPNYDKKNDLMKAFQYLALYYFNTNDKAKTKVYMDKIEAIDANDSLFKQLKNEIAKPAKPGKK